MLSIPEITSMTQSVTLAPLCLILANASCPGVSMKVKWVLSFKVMLKAPIVCVILPNSWSTRLEFLNVSRRVVLPEC